MAAPKFKTAKEVSEHLLVMTADALMTRDFETFSRCFSLPQVVTTANRKTIVETREDLEKTFHSTCDHFESLGVTHLYRECVAAVFQGSERVEATHVSYVRKGDQEVVAPYPVFSTLELIDGRWQIVAADYDLDEDNAQAQALHVSSLDERELDTEAMTIYQDHLDATGRALRDGDFEAMEARVALPHRMTTETAQIDTHTRGEMRQNFEHFAQSYQAAKVTALVRVVQSARFEAPDEIIGRHVSHQLSGNVRIVPPYPNRIRLVRGPDGRWRETHCANAIRNTAKSFKLWVKVADNPRLPPLAPIPERTMR